MTALKALPRKSGFNIWRIEKSSVLVGEKVCLSLVSENWSCLRHKQGDKFNRDTSPSCNNEQAKYEHGTPLI